MAVANCCNLQTDVTRSYRTVSELRLSLPDIPHPLIFFMTSGTACSLILFTSYFFCGSRPLSHSGCYGNIQRQTQCITAHACQHVNSLRFCRGQVSGKFVPVTEAKFVLRISGSRAESSGALVWNGPFIYFHERFHRSSKFTKLMTVLKFLKSSYSCYWAIV